MTDLTKARSLAQQLVEALAVVATPPTPTPDAPAIDTPDAFERALAASPHDAVLTLAPSFVYPNPLTIRQPVTLRSAALVAERMTADAPAPMFLGGITIASDDVALYGLAVKHTRTDTNLVSITGSRVVLDRLRVTGDPVKGAKRGIAANGTTVAILRCYVADCFGPYPGDDTQAICAWDMGPGLLIEDNYLSGGSETIMIGGSDPSTALRCPRIITIRKNTITKDPAWFSKPIGVKNTLELKNARTVLIEDNIIEYSWGGKGQDGFLLMLTPRNQGGKIPESTVEDVTIDGNRFAHGAAAINMLGTDNNHTSGRLKHVTISHNSFIDLDPVQFKGSAHMIQIANGPTDITINENDFLGKNMTSQIYFMGAPLCENMKVTNNTWPAAKYKIFGDGATVGKGWEKYVNGATSECSGNKEL